MRLTVASPLFALVALEVTAQDTRDVFSFTSVPTRTAEVQPSATETATGLISTSSACAQISDIVMNSELEYPSVQAEVSFRNAQGEICPKPLLYKRTLSEIIVGLHSNFGTVKQVCLKYIYKF